MMKRKRQPKRSTLPLAGGQAAKNPTIRSRALKVHSSQVEEANQVAQEMGCGTPFQADGMFEESRSNTKRYVEEINRRRGEGEARLVNFDGGYGDPT